MTGSTLGQMPKATAQKPTGAAPSPAEARPRERLAAAAVALIAEAGWRAATTRGVAARAGVNPGLVHYHYRSVAALRREAALGAMSVVFEPAMASLAEAPDVELALRGAIEAIRQIEPTRPEARVSLEAMLESQRDPELRLGMLELLNDFRAVLEERLHERFSGSRLDAAGAAAVVAAALDGLALHVAIDPDTDLGGAGGALVSMLEGAAR